MTTLVAGPSSAGKSTFIQHNYPASRTIYGFEITEHTALPSGIVHYNILFRAGAAAASELDSLPPDWDFMAEPKFRTIIASGQIDKAIVIVAPIAELRERMAIRQAVEPMRASPGRYPNRKWLDILSKVDLFAIYERLFDALDAAFIPYDVLYSSAAFSSDGEPVFLPSDRARTHQNLRGIYHPSP